MRLKLYFFFFFYSLLFLFYPGNSIYTKIFLYNRDLFEKKENKKILKINYVPYSKSFSSPSNISAQGVYVVDLNSFTPIYKKNEKSLFIPASTTKIITALVAFDIYKPDEIINVKRIITEGQVMGLKIGERITVENLLYGILIHSANDAAYVLADNYDYEKFIKLMNKKAKHLKMTNTNFTDPAGLEEKNQYTSPFDLALAGRALLSNSYLAKIVSIKEITISDIDFKYYHRLINVNKLLGEISGLGGLKTGYTQNAGENLVSYYKKDNHNFIIVVLKSEDRFNDTSNIIKWINESVDYLNI